MGFLQRLRASSSSHQGSSSTPASPPQSMSKAQPRFNENEQPTNHETYPLPPSKPQYPSQNNRSPHLAHQPYSTPAFASGSGSSSGSGAMSASTSVPNWGRASSSRLDAPSTTPSAPVSPKAKTSMWKRKGKDRAKRGDIGGVPYDALQTPGDGRYGGMSPSKSMPAMLSGDLGGGNQGPNNWDRSDGAGHTANATGIAVGLSLIHI